MNCLRTLVLFITFSTQPHNLIIPFHKKEKNLSEFAYDYEMDFRQNRTLCFISTPLFMPFFSYQSLTYLPSQLLWKLGTEGWKFNLLKSLHLQGSWRGRLFEFRLKLRYNRKYFQKFNWPPNSDSRELMDRLTIHYLMRFEPNWKKNPPE